MRFKLVFYIILLGACSAAAQSDEDIAIAQAFFDAHDIDGDKTLSQEEFVQGFINQSRKENPNQTRLAMVIFGRGRIENCLGLGFERADLNANGFMTIEELGEAYREDAFADLQKIC